MFSFSFLQDTDRNYDAAVALCLEHLQRAALMIATHNPDSLVRAAARMRALSLPAGHDRIAFAQLYGMADHLSLALANRGFMVGLAPSASTNNTQSCKYVPCK